VNQMELRPDIYVAVAYLAPLHYYARMLSANHVYIEQHENYIKQTYRNRCVILSANGAMPLSIPVDKKELIKCPIREIRLSTHTSWQKLHWRAIEAAYNSSPFFEYYRDEIAPVFQNKWTFLFDLNIALQETILSCMELSPSISFTEHFDKTTPSSTLDFRESIQPVVKPEKADPYYQAIPYYQVFAQKWGFEPNLSIIDLLFNMGPEASLVLQRMVHVIKKA
jgi:hypothetical protein